MSGKPRVHKGGRPSNQRVIKAQADEISRLRMLIAHRRHSDQTWKIINRILLTIEELEDLNTPARAASWDDGGHSAERPVLPGVELTDRGLKHAGSYAEYILRWFNRQLDWTVKVAEQRISNKEEDPKPMTPRRYVAEGAPNAS
jgi:hypothetical protein